MQQHGSKYFGQNSTFSEHGHVAYQIKWNEERSNVVAKILSAYMTVGVGLKVEIQFFQNLVMLRIK